MGSPAPKKPIAEATKYQELFQHYYVADLQQWAADNGLKVSGTKKVLIERILAFNGGDTENTMATTTTNRAPRKPATKKVAPTPNPPTNRLAAIASGVQTSKKIVCDVPKITSKSSKAPAKSTKGPAKSTKAPAKSTKAPAKKNAPKPAKTPAKEPVAPVQEEDEEEEIVEDEEEVVEDEEDEVEEEEDEVEEEEDEVEEEEDQDAVDESGEQDVEGSAEEASFDEEAEKAAIDAERELRTVEEEEEGSEMMLSEASNDYPTDIKGKIFAFSSLDENSQHSKKQLMEIVKKNGGIVSKTLTKQVQVIITKKGSTAEKAAIKYGIPVFGEEYLTNFF